MTYDFTRAHEFSDDVAEEAARTKMATISRTSSFDSINQDAPLNDYFSSEELDKLSSCLSEVCLVSTLSRIAAPNTKIPEFHLFCY
ncbi:unnamed protein product [Heligmosomoides polygyrus]|uniref:Ovule protein n=1 Tax=Heligmosomoides polygyrus TaxID=6339 RepID=A0A183G5B4_HELPZ|nr:unnamed protein product [Heligmosomoides polygyrus]